MLSVLLTLSAWDEGAVAREEPSPPSARTPSPRMCLEPAEEPPVAQPVGLHPGVLCDRTLSPIVGYRYTDGAGYDLCQAEFDKLDVAGRRRLTRVAPPVTPRRALLAAAVAAVAAQLASLAAPPSPSDGCGAARTAASPSDVTADCYAAFDTPYGTLADDFLMPPPPSAAETLLDLVFSPRVPAGQREANPTAKRRLGARSSKDPALTGSEPPARRSAPPPA